MPRVRPWGILLAIGRQPAAPASPRPGGLTRARRRSAPGRGGAAPVAPAARKRCSACGLASAVAQLPAPRTSPKFGYFGEGGLSRSSQTSPPAMAA
jgi:hypothetical protein